MVGKESYEADAGGIGFLFPFRYLSCHMKIKSHVYLLGVGQQDKESHQISDLPDTLMMTDYKGRAIKIYSDMANFSLLHLYGTNDAVRKNVIILFSVFRPLISVSR